MGIVPNKPRCGKKATTGRLRALCWSGIVNVLKTDAATTAAHSLRHCRLDYHPSGGAHRRPWLCGGAAVRNSSGGGDRGRSRFIRRGHGSRERNAARKAVIGHSRPFGEGPARCSAGTGRASTVATAGIAAADSRRAGSESKVPRAPGRHPAATGCSTSTGAATAPGDSVMAASGTRSQRSSTG
jgi:hypothetical protein